MRFGYFDNENREYVITDPRTPVKWINYIGTRQFGGFVDHTGGALVCKDDPTFNRITKYIQQLPSSEFKGETLYLRIHHEGWVPYLLALLRARRSIRTIGLNVSIGLGYTRIVSEFYGLRTEATIFVPRNGTCELRDIQITNISPAPLEVDAIPVVEYTHPNALMQFTNADWVPQTMVSKCVA